MPASVVCPNCKLSLKCSERSAGKQGRCTRCKTVFTIPTAQSQNGETQDPAPQPSPVPSAKAAAPSRRHPDRIPRLRSAAQAAGSSPAARQPDHEYKLFPAADQVTPVWRSWPVLLGGGVLLAAVLTVIVRWQASGGRDDAAFAAVLAGVETAGNNTPVAIAALEGYLAERPGGRHAMEAGDRIKALDTAAFAAAEAKAKAAGEDYGRSIEAYKDYLAALPNGRGADEARKRAEKDLPTAWDDYAFAKSEAQAKAAGDSASAACAAYRRYLSVFPNGRHAQQAKAAQERADHEDYTRAKEEAEAAVPARAFERAIAAYQGYLQRFPQGLNAAAAKRAIEVDLAGKADAREFEKAKTAAEAACARRDYECAIAAYQEYLKACPQGQHVALARQAVEKDLPDAKAFGEAKDAAEAGCANGEYDRAVAAYTDYLNRFPQGQHVAVVQTERTKAVEAGREIGKMYCTIEGGIGEAVVTIHRAPGGSLVFRVPFREGAKNGHRETKDGHSICVTYSAESLKESLERQLSSPGVHVTVSGVDSKVVVGSVEAVTWDGYRVREEKKEGKKK